MKKIGTLAIRVPEPIHALLQKAREGDITRPTLGQVVARLTLEKYAKAPALAQKAEEMRDAAHDMAMRLMGAHNGDKGKAVAAADALPNVPQEFIDQIKAEIYSYRSKKNEQ